MLYTPEEIANARRNAQSCDWAKAELDALLEKCRPWIDRSNDEIWSLITGQAIPRGIHVNPDLGCPSCGRAVYECAGNYPWKISLDRPWKLECPSCGEIWPKNDFAAFHESGLGPGGVFYRDRADESLLFNCEHADASDPLRGYAVDDGMGWVDEEENRWWFISFYSHYCTWGELPAGASSLATAYLYTGERSYAHKAALILDRIADVYPAMDLTPYSEMGLYNSHGGTGKGRLQGCIWETMIATRLSRAWGMVCDAVDGDAELVDFLSVKAQQWGIENDKSTPARVRENVETNLLREFICSCRDRRISGNEGMTQTAMATAAAALDDLEETPAALDWLFEPGSRRDGGGGHIPAVLIGAVDRDGVGDEASPSYSFLWMHQFRSCAEVLERCKEYRDYDLYRDFPRLRKMCATPYRLTALDRYTPHIGDTGQTGSSGMIAVDLEIAVDGFRRFGDPYLAQLAYKLNGDRVKGLHTSIFDSDPEVIQEQVRAVVEREGGVELKSDNLNGYGLTLFRSGAGDQQRAAWLYYGRNAGHGHRDRLNFGLYYRGMDLLPDLGYPEYADSKWPKRAGWTTNTISHNTVMVDRRQQETDWIGQCRLYAASEDVGIVEVASPGVYPQTRDYRRTLAMVDLSDSESYLIDFFRVDGGAEGDHVLSFHAGEGEVSTDGIDLTAQEQGTYAGSEIPFGTHYDGPPDGRYKGSGFAYLYDVSRALQPMPGWWIDWNLADSRNLKVGEEEVHVRYHALSSSDEASLAWGDPPQNKPGNPRRLRYLLQRNQGDDLRSFFTSVVEPYSGPHPLITSATRIDLGLSRDDLTAAAVRVATAQGRTDLILTADDSERILDLGDGVRAAGRFVLISLQEGAPTRLFLLGGTRVEFPESVLKVDRSEYRGTVKEMHREEQGDAWIDVEGDLPADLSLKDAQLRIHNDGVRDACYAIQSASPGPEGTFRLHMGEISFIRGLISEEDYDQGFTYNFAPGDGFDIQTIVHIQLDGRETEIIRSTSGFTLT
ncbi:MAG: hypothetical protein HOC74_00600 [Gemmatimonadetes bacterium]|nr:hypothetical protein [Gemmatimonadota bacterium]